MTTFNRKPRFLFTVAALAIGASLVACGGGDDPVAKGGVAVVELPAQGTSTGVTVDGTLSYLVFSPDASVRTVPADVQNAALVGSLTLKDPEGNLIASTTDGWNSVRWPEGIDGLLALDGNAGLICDTTDNSGQVGVSGNVVQVTDLAMLRGKTFRFKVCANGSVEDEGGIAFNADGSAKFEDDEETSSFSASDMASYFSEAGWPIDGGIFKARAFSRTTAGRTEYVIVDISDDERVGGARIKAVALMVELEAAK